MLYQSMNNYNLSLKISENIIVNSILHAPYCFKKYVINEKYSILNKLIRLNCDIINIITNSMVHFFILFFTFVEGFVFKREGKSLSSITGIDIWLETIVYVLIDYPVFIEFDVSVDTLLIFRLS